VATHLIATYRNVPGEHCGSTAMRNLIRHYCALELPEAVVFGLGSGIHCMLLESDHLDPSVMIFGRSATMEADVAEALGLAYLERTEVDDRAAWDVVRAEVAADRPTMLSGDAFYLDYRDFKVHFPAHRFVLVGFDDETRMAAVADRIDAAPQLCGCDALAASRNPKDFISTQNLWGRFADGSMSRSLPEACAIALRRAATRMLAQPGDGDTTPGLAGGMQNRNGAVHAAAGIAALERLATCLPMVLARPDGRALARYASSCIEVFGTGGGNFRRLYAAFLRWVHEGGYADVTTGDADAMEESARAWTLLSTVLRRFASAAEPNARDAAQAAVATIESIRGLEARTFERLARHTGGPDASSQEHR